jgi:hypothetical protein
MATETKQVCLYKTSYGSEIVSSYFEESDWIQISEPIEVTFTLLSKETRLLNEISLIENQLTEIQEEALRKMEALKERKQQLLALTHDEEI